MRIFVDFNLPQATPSSSGLSTPRVDLSAGRRPATGAASSGQYSTVHYSTVQHSIVQYSTVHLLRTENPQLFEVKLFSSKRQPRGAGGCR